jgi:Mg/Co/Ni transporter MgtE
MQNFRQIPPTAIAVARTLGVQLRPILASTVAFCFYQQALPGPIFVYWTMFFITIAGALVLSRFVQFIEHLIGPDCGQAGE